jgi:ubiquitin thioesterase protein OTUB1
LLPLTAPPAIAFTYFEALLRVGDASKFAQEEARLNSLGNLLEHIGYGRDIWIDFAESAFELLRKLQRSTEQYDGAAETILLDTFNDMGESMAIITFVKVRLCMHAYLLRHRLTRAAPCQCLGADACRRL